MANRETVEIKPEDLGKVEDILGSSVDEKVEEVEAQLKTVVKTAIAQSLVFDFSPCGNESAIGHGLNLLGEIIEKIPELQASRSKGQNICLKFLGKKPVARLWFSKSKMAMNTMKISETGKGGFEPKDQSRQMPENGFPVKTRRKIISEIRRYVKNRGFKVPAPETEA